MKRRPRIAVFASGLGSNFQALVDAFQAEPARYGCDIMLLICDKPQANVVKRAEAAGVPAACFTPKAYSSREQYEKDVLLKLREERIDWIVLAGYMRLITPVLLSAYGGRMLNIHPSLLPAFPGLNAVKQAFDYGVRVTGVTVHLVDEGMDTGAILAQRVVFVEEQDTEEMLAARIHAAEHELYPAAVADVVAGKLSPSRA
ncbi:phosphoribosylglycinamide formyltransferase [Paenibacillus arenosi]|uniref:Phosphoribosylglycinamide formyltransferase n=1 Tax=Paenibacillus arenosi TaxID=2774142 RepID=A0ABR9B5F4_9BACL|nr:phosphoribosylglycinamide formyltransferase [Paenibacillus arenosi]MBD8500406.1 phosphoribosylglycinamide formyltransferase [Paenibacillus arenosi]